MFHLIRLTTAIVVFALIAPTFAQTTRSAPGQCHALLIGGLPSSPVYARRYQDWLTRFHAHLTKAGVPGQNIIVLSGDKSFSSPILSGPATRDAILQAVQGLARTVAPQDQFILVMVGHGNLGDANPSLVLPGADLTPEALARALASIRADNQVILNFASAGGDFLKSLLGRNRVNLTATMPEENAEPVYAEFFLRALEKDAAVTLLQAYNDATHQTALWICRQLVQKDGSWLVEGKQSIAIFKKLFDGPDGPITPGAMRADGSRKLADDSDLNKADEVVPIVVPADIKPNTAGYWVGRRVVNEHAQLEDLGVDSPVCALGGEKGFEPIAPSKKGDEGARAARVVLSRPELAPAGGK